ncbi:hypothetical protein ABT150_03650 [Streptomyces mirabilis]
MLRHYGVDLLDWHRGHLSSRRLSVLVRHLPRNSALLKELHGEAAEWTATDYLLATVIDQLAEANWMFATVNRDDDSEPLDFPEPIPRPGNESTDTERGAPGDTAGEKGTPTADQLVQFFL